MVSENCQATSNRRKLLSLDWSEENVEKGQDLREIRICANEINRKKYWNATKRKKESGRSRK